MTPNEADDKLSDNKYILENISKTANKLNLKQPPIYEVGDKVRIKVKKRFKTKFDYNWSKKIYIVSKVFNPKKSTTLPSYQVSLDGEIIPKRYYNYDLLKVMKPVVKALETPLKPLKAMDRSLCKKISGHVLLDNFFTFCFRQDVSYGSYAEFCVIYDFSTCKTQNSTVTEIMSH